MSLDLSRRRFSQHMVLSLLTASLAETLWQSHALADTAKQEIGAWVAELHQLGLDLKGKRIEPADWQTHAEALLPQVPLEQLLAAIDFDALARGITLPDNGVRSLRFGFNKSRVASDFVYGRQIFAMKKGRSVVPHGHDNMATAFIVLKGRFRGRHYDRLEDEREHIIIQPTIDREFAPGGWSTVTDARDNVHWFQAQEEPAFIFNIHLLGVREDFPRPTGRVYLDPKGEQLAGGKIRARRIDHDEAHRLYG